MPSAVFDSQPLVIDGFAKPKVSVSNTVASPDACHSWLHWIQKLLCANSLVLYHCNVRAEKATLRQLCALPAEIAPDNVLRHLAQRCADTASLVKIDEVGEEGGSALAIPDAIGKKGKPVHYVLVIKHRGISVLDLQTQVKLVEWAFSAFEQFANTAQPSAVAPSLAQWVVTDAQRETSSCIYTQLVSEIAQRTGSSCCLLAKLETAAGEVTSVSLLAVSGQPRIDARLAASRACVTNIERAYLGQKLPLDMLNQACVERTLITQTPVSQAIEQCARLSLPVLVENTWFVIALERTIAHPFCASQSDELLDEVSAALQVSQLVKTGLLGVRATLNRRYRQWLANMGSSRIRQLNLSVAILFVLWLFFFPMEQRISAPLNVEPSERHVLIAPVDGVVESIEVKAGDQITKGQTLATLDDHDLQLQQQKLRSQSLQNEQSYAKALAEHDRVEVTRLKEELLQISTEIIQIGVQRNKMVINAPTDAVVLSATLDDYLGATISAGETLFSLGSIDSNRLVLDVSEYDVQHVQVGQAVGLRLSANPSRVLAAEVVAIMPLVVASAGVNTVQVHAELIENESLRPGMQGLGKILVARQALGVQWSKRAASRLFWLGWKLGLLR